MGIFTCKPRAKEVSWGEGEALLSIKHQITRLRRKLEERGVDFDVQIHLFDIENTLDSLSRGWVPALPELPRDLTGGY